MKYQIKSTQIYTENGLLDGYLQIENGIISNIASIPDDSTLIDVGSYRILPGIIDIHTHGYKGISFTNDMKRITQEEIEMVCSVLPEVGITGFTPAPDDTALDELVLGIEKKYKGARILGIYSEGPFTSRSGENIAIDEHYIKPDMEITKRYIEKCKGHLKVMAMAPEMENAKKVIQYLLDNNVAVSACHTNATYKQMIQAYSWGVSCMTHLGNVMTGIHHRDVGALGAGLLNDDIYCEIITDLHHLNKEMLQIMFRVKKNNRFILISDSVCLSGLQAGRYELMPDYYVVLDDEKTIRDEHGRYCGSAMCIRDGIRNLVEVLNLPLEKVIEMFSLNPAKLLHIDETKGSLKIGKDADFFIADHEWNILATYVEGEKVYGTVLK